MRASRFHQLGLIAAVALLSACIDRSSPTSPGIPASAHGVDVVAVKLPVTSLEVGSVVSAAATSTNAAGQSVAGAEVQWLSSDNSVLGVNSAGQVTARKMGTASVYATIAGVAGKSSLQVTDSLPRRVLVSPRSTNIKVGVPLQLSVAVTTATGRALPQHPVAWKTSDSLLAKVNSRGVVTGVGSGIAAIIASTQNAADTAYVNVSAVATPTGGPMQPPAPPATTPPPPPPAPAPTPNPVVPVTSSGTHEPSIMRAIHDWDGHSRGAWLSASAPNEQFVWDDALQNTVMQLQYLPVVVSKSTTYGPDHLYYPMPASTYPLHSVYLRAQVKLSANWKQNPSGVLKIFEVFSGRTWAIPGVYGWGSDLRLMVANDEPTDPLYPGCFVGQSAPSCAAVSTPPDVFTLDQWHTIEVVLVSNTPGVSNGRLMTWLDGKPQTSVSNVMWSVGGTDNSFRQFDLNPLWGGLGGTLTALQTLRIGQIHLSGSSTYLSGPVP